VACQSGGIRSARCYSPVNAGGQRAVTPGLLGSMHWRRPATRRATERRLAPASTTSRCNRSSSYPSTEQPCLRYLLWSTPVASDQWRSSHNFNNAVSGCVHQGSYLINRLENSQHVGTISANKYCHDRRPRSLLEHACQPGPVITRACARSRRADRDRQRAAAATKLSEN